MCCFSTFLYMLSETKLRESLQYPFSDMIYVFIFYVIYYMYLTQKISCEDINNNRTKSCSTYATFSSRDFLFFIFERLLTYKTFLECLFSAGLFQPPKQRKLNDASFQLLHMMSYVVLIQYFGKELQQITMQKPPYRKFQLPLSKMHQK